MRLCVAAVALFNLSCCERVRARMVEAGVVTVLSGLASPDDDIAVHVDVVSALLNISSDTNCELPLLQEGGLKTVVRIADDVDATTEVLELCARSVCALSRMRRCCLRRSVLQPCTACVRACVTGAASCTT
jgi:hypothetical protein